MFSSRYIAPKSFRDQASTKRPAESRSGDPGTPAIAPKMNAITATTNSGTIRVTRRRRRATSGERLFTVAGMYFLPL